MKELKNIFSSTILVFMISFHSGFTQDKMNNKVGVSYSKSYIDKEFADDKVYEKLTGEKLTRSQVNKLLKENPRLVLEKVFDEEGRVVKYLYDETIQGLGPQNRIEPEGNFGKFKFTSIDDEKISSEDLLGTLVLIRFAVFPEMFHHKANEIKALDEIINSSPNKGNIRAFILFNGSKQEIKAVFDYKESNFVPVANAMNFMQKFGIKRFPKTLVIDEKGILIEKFSYSEDINLDRYFEKD
ncbi:hypothetical protein [Croceitalea sp. P059]|uniref:TlpA family protein disulfide reductase n=1 Tax=Croceitalea sp. P059 TaxID=3075601 RepID=UPI0028881E10|nr:hypothetical protein [Croceitalea sp. P059]MDT0541003.1 hypothetical protein [Croceitalea sp. P059]